MYSSTATTSTVENRSGLVFARISRTPSAASSAVGAIMLDDACSVTWYLKSTLKALNSVNLYYLSFFFSLVLFFEIFCAAVSSPPTVFRFTARGVFTSFVSFSGCTVPVVVHRCQSLLLIVSWIWRVVKRYFRPCQKRSDTSEASLARLDAAGSRGHGTTVGTRPRIPL